MITILGNIRVGNRKNFFYSSLESFRFLKNKANIILNIEDIDQLDKDILFEICDDASSVYLDNQIDNFGKVYCNLLSQSKDNWIWHFEEDHFCTQNSVEYIEELLNFATENSINLIKSSFFNVEKESYKNCTAYNSHDKYGKCIFLDQNNYNLANDLVYRYYIGNNSIWNKYFAYMYWSRHIATSRPHEYEIREYNGMFLHNLLIPNSELLRSIDDDHGENNSCLLKNSCKKWEEIYGKYKSMD